jgi:hypothetical protein
MDSGKLQPALLGGLFVGILSALPIINMGNCCCCLWVLGGGVLAVYLRQQNSPTTIESSEGALLGLMAGAIGAIIGGLISIPIAMMMGPLQGEWMSRILQGNEDMPPEAREMMERMLASGAMGGFAIIGMLINLVIYSVFGTLGGLLGVAIFKKNAPPPPPPPPPTVIVHDPGTAQ